MQNKRSCNDVGPRGESMKEELFKLVTLNSYDRQIADLCAHIEETNSKIDSDEKRLAVASSQVEKKRKEVLSAKVAADRIDGDVKALEARYKECNYQLLALKDKNSYDAMRAQLVNYGEAISAKETECIEYLQKADDLEKTHDGYVAKVEEERSRIDEMKSKCAQELEKLRPELEALKEKRDAYSKCVRSDLMGLYTRLSSRAGAKPVVALNGRNCTACYSAATLETVEKVKMMKSVVCCDQCGSILYYAAQIAQADED